MNDSGKFRIPSGDPSDASHNGSSARDRLRPERRQRRRALISAPVRVRSAYGGSNGPDEISTTVDVSRNGFLFLSTRPTFAHGSVVAVTFPYSKSALAVQAEQPGRVARVSALADGRFAVAIALGCRRKLESASAKRAIADDSRPLAHRSRTPAERPLVVVVDADIETRESLKGVLSAEGYEVIALSGARQAHALLNQLLPALLIAEIEGEDLPGLDLCARIKSTPRLKNVPVVLTTRSAYPSDYANAHSLGAVVCIAKPFRPARVGHVVRLLVPSGDAQRG
jgi:CheY-like chemotaxis protein